MRVLEGKTAVITGASSGIGKAIAKLFAQAGANVIVNYCRSEQQALNVVEEIKQSGQSAIAVPADVADPDAIERLIYTTLQHYEQIDIWVNNAGADILTGTGATADTKEKLERLIDVDLKGTLNACWALAPIMQEGGTIINMGWDLAVHGFVGSNPQLFSAIKAGILGFTRSFAKTVGPKIRVNMLAPGWIETAFFTQGGMSASYYQARIEEIPLGRFGTTEDVAGVALFLASDAASYLTGEVININGGLI